MTTKPLQRRLYLPSVIAISISAMLGSGIFVLPGLAAAKTGSSIWLAYIVAGLCVLPAALSKSELATAMPFSGGTYVYLDRAFGPLVGTVAGLGLWVSLLLKSSFALIGFGAYLVIFTDLSLKPTALALLGGIMLLNIRGIRGVGRVQLIVMTASLLGLGGLAVSGFFHFEPANLENTFAYGSGGFFSAVGFLFVSYAGVTKVAAIAGEIRRPERNLPLGILISLGTVTIIYGAVALVLAGNIPLSQLQSDIHPIYTLAKQVGGSQIGIAAAVLGVLTMASMANAGVLAASRFPFAMSRDALLPKNLSILHSKYLTPVTCILLSGLVVAVSILALDVERLAKLASAFMIMIYVTENIAVIVLRESRPQWYQPGFHSPLYPWVQMFGILSGAALLTLMGMLAFMACLLIVPPGIVFFQAYGRKRTKRRGVVGLRGRRLDLLQEPATSILTETAISSEKAVVVPLFGRERAPEKLVQLAQVLGEEATLEIFHLTEVPEQTALDTMPDENPDIQSLRRRILALSEGKSNTIEFTSVVSHDILRTVYKISSRLHSNWLVMEWGGRTLKGLSFDNPLGWLRDHLACNLAILYDAGIQDFRKILVYPEPGPHDVLVIKTADLLANVFNAKLTFARYVDETEPLTATQNAADYLDQVGQLSKMPSEALILTGRDEAAAFGQASGSYDLLITAGTPQKALFRGSRSDRLIDKAACSVLKIITPRLQPHKAAGRARTRTTFDQPNFMSLIDKECVVAKIEPMKKEILFDYFAHTFAAKFVDLETTEVVRAFEQREHIQNTAVGNGLAIPHATINEVQQTHLGIFTTTEPVDYRAPDKQKVDVFFVTLGAPADRQMHVNVLSMISKLMLQTNVLENIRTATGADEILGTVKKCCAELRI